MSAPYVIPLTPEILATLAVKDEGEEGEAPAFREWCEIEPFVDRLPATEADAVELYYRLGKRQKEIAEILEMTQAGVSYRLSKARKRLKFMASVPALTEEDIRRDLADVFPDTIDCTACKDLACSICAGTGKMAIVIEVLVCMAATTCQEETGRRLGISQGRTRYRFIRAVAALEQRAVKSPELAPYATKLFSMIKKHGVILRWVDSMWWRRDAEHPRWRPER